MIIKTSILASREVDIKNINLDENLWSRNSGKKTEGKESAELKINYNFVTDT